MIHRLKTLGLAAIAVLAMSAVVASAAQAQFTSNSYPTTVTATSAPGNDVFTVDGSSLECATHYQGTLAEASTALSLTITSTNCKAFGFASGSVTRFNCRTTWTSNGETHQECEKEVIHVGNCEVQIGSQTGLKSISLTNNGNHIDALASVTGITANVTKDGFLCPLSGTGHKSATFKQGSKITVVPVSGGTDLTVH